MTVPVVVMPDAELVVVTALRAFLSGRSEDYCQGVTVGTMVAPGAAPARFVRVRRFGGRTLDKVTDISKIDVVIWNDDAYSRMALGQLVRGFLEAMIGVYGDVACYGGTTFMTPQQMPDPADDTREVVMLSVDIAMHGTQLA